MLSKHGIRRFLAATDAAATTTISGVAVQLNVYFHGFTFYN